MYKTKYKKGKNEKMIYRTEHPNPQWERKEWKNLNGEWEFDFDFGRSAREKELFKKSALTKKINVPFCPESELSGIGYKDFIDGACYRKVITLSDEEVVNNVILHFGAVDYKSYIYVNGEYVRTHIGGFASFDADITKFVKSGENEIFVIVEDERRSGEQPSGKQSDGFESYGCFYTRTTGIWQTVWLEFIKKEYVKKAKYYPNIKDGSLTVIGEVEGGGVVEIKALYEGKEVGSAICETENVFTAKINLSEVHLWEPGHGRLYDLEISFKEDKVKSYFGLRNVKMQGMAFTINSKKVFQRFVLDQGYYPDGIMTAKTDEDLKKDIEISMNAGFNGARLHQKVFEKRFLYHCDKAGYMVWGEHGNWGIDYTNIFGVENFIAEWTEIVERDFNHPAIIGWCPVNETWGYYEKDCKHRFLETTYKVTKQMDNTRPCIAVSGNYHPEDMEIYDIHDYCGNIDEFREDYSHIAEGKITDQVKRTQNYEQPYKGQPVFVSEYGGFGWIENGEEGWGYGENPKTKEELFQRYKDFTLSLLENPYIMGFCYTQLYDLEQEKNGLYTYGRVAKLDMDKIREVNQTPAKIEEN